MMKSRKVINLSLVALVALLAFAPMVHAADFTCAVFGDNFLIDEKFATIVKTVVLIIQVVVPILLVVWGMLDLAKAVMAQKEDEIKKGQQTFIKRLIAAAIVFFVIAVVKLVVNFVADDKGIMSCVDCFLQGADSASCQPADGGGTSLPADPTNP